MYGWLYTPTVLLLVLERNVETNTCLMCKTYRDFITNHRLSFLLQTFFFFVSSVEYPWITNDNMKAIKAAAHLTFSGVLYILWGQFLEICCFHSACNFMIFKC